MTSNMEFNEVVQPGQEVFDYTRCQRPDGSYYGTGGTCRKGAEVGPKEKAALKKAAAAGNQKAKVALAVAEGKMTKAEAKKELGSVSETKPAPKEEAPKKEAPKKEEAPKAQEDARPFAAEKLSGEELRKLPDGSRVDMADGEVYIKKDGKFYRKKEDGSLSEMADSPYEIASQAKYMAKVNTRETEGRGLNDSKPEGGDQGSGLSGKFDGAKPLGEGGYAQVRETADGTIIKKGELGKEEVAVQERLAGVDGVPKVKNSEGNIIEMERARGKAMMDSDLYNEAAYGNGPSKASGAAADDVVRLLKETHQRGVSHGDLHDGNVYITEDGKAGLIDFGMGRVSRVSALDEGLNFGADGNYKSAVWMSDLTSRGNAGPAWTRLQSNQAEVFTALRDAGFNPNKSLMQQGMTSAQAQTFIDQLYDGV